MVVGHDEGKADAEEAARTVLTEASPFMATDDWDVTEVRFLGASQSPAGPAP